jgi:hypothetical protein
MRAAVALVEEVLLAAVPGDGRFELLHGVFRWLN